MTIIDLSHPITDGMTTYPGLPAPKIGAFLTREASREKYTEGTEFHIGCIDMVGNTGTYLDTPFHRFADGWDLADLDLNAIVAVPLTVVEGTATGPTDPDAIDGLAIEGHAVIIRTGWDRHFNTEAYGAAGHPYVSTELAEELVTRGARLVGVDMVNVDNTMTGDRPVHTVLLRAGIPIVEHLRSLDQLDPSASMTFTAVPPPIRGLGTFAVRAFATVVP